MTKITLIFINLFLLISLCLNAQLLQEDNNILFIKANVLYDTDRFDEAVRLYNRILKDDSSFSRALFMRGKAKFALGAFKGTKSDMLEYVEQRGINEEWIQIMANTELRLKNENSALSYLELLVKLNPYEGKHFAQAAQILANSGNKNKACEYWIQSAKLGDSEGAKQASVKCAYDHSIHLPSKPSVPTIDEEMPQRDEVLVLEESKNAERDSIDLTKDEESEFIDVSVKTTSPHVDMNASQDIVIDDELTLTLNSGLGSRKIDKLPNILMLSDQSGRVVLDLCIEGGGSVLSAKLNSELTTIYRSSLSSMAIRKAKQMLFMPSLVDTQCGLLIFSIDTKG